MHDGVEQGPVVVGVDGRPEGLDALALGARLAAVAGVELVAVAAYPYAPLGSRSLDVPTDAESARRALDGARHALGRVRRASFRGVAGSSPGRTLHEVAGDLGAGVIVVGSSHHGPVGRLVLGGVTAETLRRAPCAVALAPRGWASGARALARIGVAVDGSDRDEAALGTARRLAARLDPPAEVETIHVERGRRAGRAVQADVRLQGDPADALAAHSPHLGLLVLGTDGLVLGSVGARLVGTARCPVLAEGP